MKIFTIVLFFAALSCFVMWYLNTGIFNLKVRNSSKLNDRELSRDLQSLPINSEFYFRDKSIRKDIIYTIPRVDLNTVTEYEELGHDIGFYFCKTDHQGRLQKLETWERKIISDIPLNTLITGTFLEDFDLPLIKDNHKAIAPLFFMQKGEDWQIVSAKETIGKSKFIRLRWVKSIRNNTEFLKLAEQVEQYPLLSEEFIYDENGLHVETRKESR